MLSVPGKNVQNDIALVRLNRMVELNEGVQIACLPLGKSVSTSLKRKSTDCLPLCKSVTTSSK
jgi:Trypsin